VDIGIGGRARDYTRRVLVLTGLLRFVLHMPDEVVFGRILPACGLMLFTSTLYYAWLAYRLAKETGRDDVTALPSGTSVPHMFVVVFVIMLPIALKTWRSGQGMGGRPHLGIHLAAGPS
jgi:xanthine/uracil/vitamin C permease (AzgA family)